MILSWWTARVNNPRIVRSIATGFDRDAKVWYNWFHNMQGYIQTKDRWQ